MKKTSTRFVAFFLMAVMLLGMVPMNAFAEGGSVSTYEEFMEDLKVLESYADAYAAEAFKDSAELVLNFIRTGVERYQDDNWNTLAGPENTSFTNYVARMDAENGTSAMDLRDIKIDKFILPNGNQTDFGHMFGCMNISYVAPGSADLSGWAGDICDLLMYSAFSVTIPEGTVDEMAEYIGKNCFGINAPNAYGWDDFYGDLDAYYLVSQYKKGAGKFSEIMKAYFDAELDDVERSVYFMNNRFGVEDSREAVRKAIYEAYSSDVGLKVLEAKRELTSYSTLRQACCYAFADYVYEQAKGQLVPGDGGGEEMDNEYYTVFSSDYSVLAPGIEQEINYAKTADGKQIVYYVATVDVTRDDVTIMANYKDNDPSKGWGYQRVEDQVKAMVNNKKGEYEYFTPVVATNADGYNMSTGEPSGLLVMDGKTWHPVNSNGFFAILKDGSAMIGTRTDYEAHKDELQEAIGGFGTFLVVDGKINVTKNSNYAATRASRTAIGIKPDGSVVMMVLDGRQLPFSAGGAMEEIAQIMYDAGCEIAINLDGGGSTTYLSKPAGSNDIKLVNRPSDGYARSVSTSLVAVSFAKSSNEFDHAIISSDYEYITAGTSMQFSVTGVSNTGNIAIIPEGSYWKVSDETVGTIDKDTGMFTAVANGNVTVEYIVNGSSAGSKDISVVTPDDIKFAEDRITAIYGVPQQIDVSVWYKGFPVAFTPMKDAFVFFNYKFDEYGNPELFFTSDAGVINGLEFVGTDAKKIRSTPVFAALIIGKNIIAASANINLYYEDEALFDFENATSGNRTLAYYREVLNARTADNMLYRISDPNAPIDIEYTFALDLTTISIPVQLEPLQSMLPGADQENVTAWNFMLQLAERVCELTNVTITVGFSENLDVDISELKIINDYFELTSATVDEENNILTIKCNWIDQTAAIDAATANPLCILAGIKATVKEDANYVNNEILISNNGYVKYEAYLAASSLKSFADDPANQAQFGLYPYVHTPACRTDGNDAGAKFSGQYADFADVYVINSENRQGWNDESYYVDNVAVTGIQYIPSKADPTKYLFYEFDEAGICLGEANNLIEYQGDKYYVSFGEKQTGWQSWTDADDNQLFYYCDPATGKAVDGTQTIGGYNFVFENCVLVRGDLVKRGCNCVGGKNQDAAHVGCTGTSYRWASDWASGKWVEVDGEYYYFRKYHTIAVTGLYGIWDSAGAPTDKTGYYLFDENGRFMKEFTGIYNDYYIENGVAWEYRNHIVQVDGYYYCVASDLKIIKNAVRSIDANIAGIYKNAIPKGDYTFDEQGRMTNALVKTDGLEKIEGCEAEVLGKVVNITTTAATPAFKVGYVDDGDLFVEVEGKKTDDGSYKYEVAAEATGVFVVVIGDVNSDGKLDNDDVAKLAASLTPLGQDIEGSAAFAADINGNNRINSADRILIARLLLPEDHPLHLDIEDILKN